MESWGVAAGAVAAALACAGCAQPEVDLSGLAEIGCVVGLAGELVGGLFAASRVGDGHSLELRALCTMGDPCQDGALALGARVRGQIAVAAPEEPNSSKAPFDDPPEAPGEPGPLPARLDVRSSDEAVVAPLLETDECGRMLLTLEARGLGSAVIELSAEGEPRDSFTFEVDRPFVVDIDGPAELGVGETGELVQAWVTDAVGNPLIAQPEWSWSMTPAGVVRFLNAEDPEATRVVGSPWLLLEGMSEGLVTLEAQDGELSEEHVISVVP